MTSSRQRNEQFGACRVKDLPFVLVGQQQPSVGAVAVDGDGAVGMDQGPNRKTFFGKPQGWRWFQSGRVLEFEPALGITEHRNGPRLQGLPDALNDCLKQAASLDEMPHFVSQFIEHLLTALYFPKQLAA